MAFEDDEDVTGAIDTGEEYTPPAQDAAPSQAPAPQQSQGSAGMQDIGEAPFAQEAGRTPVREGMANLARDTGKSWDRGVENVKNSMPGRMAKHIVSYLMAAGADNPHMVQAAADAVDPQKQLSADDRNLLAVQKAAEEQGPDAAWKLAQGHRAIYNAKQAFAYTALNGTQQKPPDINAAVDAANQAASHVLDGSTAQFAVDPRSGAITATVSQPGGQPQTVQLSPEQFRKYLNVGGDGQYDRLQKNTVFKTLVGMSRSNGGMTSLDQMRPLPQQQEDKGAIPMNDDGSPYVPEEPKSNFGKTPSTQNLSGNDKIRVNPQTAVEATGYGDALEARAQRMFPSISQEAQRNQWMAQEEQRQEGNQNKVDVARETGLYRQGAAEARGRSQEEVAKTNAASHEKVADIKTKGWMYASDGKRAAAQIAADQKAAHDGNVDARARLETARKAISTKRMTGEKIEPAELELEKQMTQGGMAAVQPGARPQTNSAAPKPAQAPQTSGSPGQPPVPGAKFYKGKWYTRGQNGESVPVN